MRSGVTATSRSSARARDVRQVSARAGGGDVFARARQHVAPMPELGDQMCDFGLNGLSDNTSPDRLDALVWAVTELTAPRPMPRMRML